MHRRYASIVSDLKLRGVRQRAGGRTMLHLVNSARVWGSKPLGTSMIYIFSGGKRVNANIVIEE